MITELEIKAALEKVSSAYGLNHAKRLEQLYRNETAHFKSGNFKATLSPGMEVGKSTKYPYGWNSLKPFWDFNPQYRPIGTFAQAENTSALSKKRGVRTFIKFGTIEASMMSVAELINIRDNNFGRWFASQDHPDKIQAYNNELDKIKVRLV